MEEGIADGSEAFCEQSNILDEIVELPPVVRRRGQEIQDDLSERSLFRETILNCKFDPWTLKFLNADVQNRFESFCMKQYPWFFAFIFFTFPALIAILYFYVELIRVRDLPDGVLVICSIAFFVGLIFIVLYKIKLWSWLQHHSRAVQIARTREFTFNQSTRIVFILGNISGILNIVCLGMYCIVSTSVKSCIYFCYADVPIVLTVTTFYMPFHIMQFVHLDWIYVIIMSLLSGISIIVTFAIKGLITTEPESILSFTATSILCSFYIINIYYYYRMKLSLFRNSEIFSAVVAEERRLLKDADDILDIFF